MEKLQKDASQPLDLERHAGEVQAALDDAKKQSPDSQNQNGSSVSGIDVLVAGEMIVSAFCDYRFAMLPVLIYHAMSSEPKREEKPSTFHSSAASLGNKKKVNEKRDIMLGRGSAFANLKREKSAVSFVSLDGTRKGLRNKTVSVGEKIEVVRQSTTGKSHSDGKKTETKGFKVNALTAKLLVYAELLKELGVTKKTQIDPYADGFRRLQEDLKKGVDAAERIYEQRKASLNIPAPTNG